jgi:hypothetical protein
LTRGVRTRAAWLAAFGASALANAADPPSTPAEPEPFPDAELLEFLGSEDGADDMWNQFLAWLETTADPKREKSAREAEGDGDE